MTATAGCTYRAAAASSPSRSFYLVFEGLIDSVESGFARNAGGQRLWLDATGTSNRGDGRTPMQTHWGEGVPPGETKGQPIKLSKVLQEAAARAGYSISVSSRLANIERDYWAMTTESFHHFGARLAAELGGIFKISGANASMTDRLSFDNAAGVAMAHITATGGDNLIEWRIKPYASRPRWASALAQYFDVQKAQWQKVVGAIGAGGSGFVRRHARDHAITGAGAECASRRATERRPARRPAHARRARLGDDQRRAAGPRRRPPHDRRRSRWRRWRLFDR
jgi:hypothetical protein